MNIEIKVSANTLGWLAKLAVLGVFGKEGNIEEVVNRFVSDGIRKELAPGGLLESPPELPKVE